jgi:YD repeat-containing protein
MKTIYFLIILLFPLSIFAQSLNLGVHFHPSKEEILKFKISKITIRSSEDSDAVKEYYFDEEGNDTALYIDGKLSWNKKYEKNKQAKIIKSIQYDFSGHKLFTSNYDYEDDGTYRIAHTNEKYQLIDLTEVYDKTGRIQRELLNDGGQHIYKYDSIDRLSRIDSEPGFEDYNQFTSEYTYYDNNLLSSVKTIYTMNSVTLCEFLQKFFYDTKGLLLKITETTIYNLDREKGISNAIYSYRFNK